MRLYLAYFIFLSCFLALAPVYAGTETLITYYPAPTGNYNQVQTNFLRIGASTLNAIQTEYKCSYDPHSGLPSCPAGIVYFDTDAHTLAVSDGTHWRILNSTCVPQKPCSPILNCSSDDCGNSCGNCTGAACSSTTPGIPGSCA